jgi:hypothetical protein
MLLHKLFLLLRLRLGRGDHQEEKRCKNKYRCRQENKFPHPSSPPLGDLVFVLSKKLGILSMAILRRLGGNCEKLILMRRIRGYRSKAK